MVRIDQQQDRAIEQQRNGEPDRPAFYDFTIIRKNAGLQTDGADANAGQEIAGVKQDPAGLDRKRVAARLQPARIAEDQVHRQIHHRDDQKPYEGRQRPAAKGKDRPAQRRDNARCNRPHRGGDEIQRQQHPQKPCRPRGPGPDRQRVPPEMQEVEVGRAGQMIAQEGRIIGDRHQHEDRDEIGHAQPPCAAGEIVQRSPARQAVVDEQPGEQEHAGHEEAVVEQHHQIETEPAHAVAAAEMGVVDDGVVQQHQERDAGARPVQRYDTHRRRHGLIGNVRFPQHRLASLTSRAHHR